MMRTPIALLCLLLAGVPVAAQGGDATAVVGRASRVYRSLSSLRADFVQVIANPMIDTAETRGTLVQSGQAKLAMRFSSPPGEAIVIDGEHVWVYTPSTTPGQVLRFPVPSGGPVYGFNILSWLLDRPAERYEARYLRRDEVGGRSVDVVELVPRVPDLPFDRAVVWLGRDDGLPHKLEIQEKSGTTRTLTLSRIRVNEQVSPKTFNFDPPDGVRVIDQG